MLCMACDMNTYIAKNNARETAVRVLAVVGFVALVAISMWLAVYATRFVPPVVNGIGEATAYLGSVFTRAPSDTPPAARLRPGDTRIRADYLSERELRPRRSGIESEQQRRLYENNRPRELDVQIRKFCV